MKEFDCLDFADDYFLVQRLLIYGKVDLIALNLGHCAC
jgi:hypothetical protein